MTDTSHRTTAEQQAVKRAKTRRESKRFRDRALTYFLQHRWLPKSVRRVK